MDQEILFITKYICEMLHVTGNKKVPNLSIKVTVPLTQVSFGVYMPNNKSMFTLFKRYDQG